MSVPLQTSFSEVFMDSELRKKINEAIPGVIKNASAVAGANKMVHVSGQRHKIELKGRTLDMVYYAAKKENAPLIVGYHGGGFIFGGCALDDDMWCAVTAALDANVASIGYRKSPEYKWETCLADAYDGAIYMKEHFADFGFDPESISVMGQSAGGNLAAAVALKAGQTGEITFKNQILIYPFLDVYTEPGLKGEGSFSGLAPYIMNELHCTAEEAKNPLCSPYYADNSMLKNLPNTIVSVSEDDNLRPEGVFYSDRIAAAGIPMHRMLAKGMPHGYFENGFKEKFRESELQFLGEHGKEIFEDGSLRRVSEETLEFIKTYMV